MTDRAQYIQLCQEVALPLHAQAWWWEQSSEGKTWDALVLEEDDHALAAMPYHLTRKGPIQAMLMPMHTQYHHAYIAPSKSEDVYPRLAQGLDTLCRERHIAWCQMQGRVCVLDESSDIGLQYEAVSGGRSFILSEARYTLCINYISLIKITIFTV